MLGASGVLDAIARATARDWTLIAAYRGGGGVMAGPPDKVAALVECSRVLASLGVGHALIGGVAVGIHSGAPRATTDTDIAVSSTADRDAIDRALSAVGFRRTGTFAHSHNFRHSSGEPVQLVFDSAFDPMVVRAEHFSIGSDRIPIVTRADLVTMKTQAANDPTRRRSKALRDQADLELLRGDVPDPDEGW